MKNLNMTKMFAPVALGLSALVASATSMAAAVAIDTSEPLAQVGEGASAAVAIGIALIGFVVLIGVLIKTRRAGS